MGLDSILLYCLNCYTTRGQTLHLSVSIKHCWTLHEYNRSYSSDTWNI